jgi:hypothetical protein
MSRAASKKKATPRWRIDPPERDPLDRATGSIRLLPRHLPFVYFPLFAVLPISIFRAFPTFCLLLDLKSSTLHNLLSLGVMQTQNHKDASHSLKPI